MPATTELQRNRAPPKLISSTTKSFFFCLWSLSVPSKGCICCYHTGFHRKWFYTSKETIHWCYYTLLWAFWKSPALTPLNSMRTFLFLVCALVVPPKDSKNPFPKLVGHLPAMDQKHKTPTSCVFSSLLRYIDSCNLTPTALSGPGHASAKESNFWGACRRCLKVLNGVVEDLGR